MRALRAQIDTGLGLKTPEELLAARIEEAKRGGGVRASTAVIPSVTEGHGGKSDSFHVNVVSHRLAMSSESTVVK